MATVWRWIVLHVATAMLFAFWLATLVAHHRHSAAPPLCDIVITGVTGFQGQGFGHL